MFNYVYHQQPERIICGTTFLTLVKQKYFPIYFSQSHQGHNSVVEGSFFYSILDWELWWEFYWPMILKQNPVFPLFYSINTKPHRVSSELPGLWGFALRDENLWICQEFEQGGTDSRRILTSTLFCVTYWAHESRQSNVLSYKSVCYTTISAIFKDREWQQY